MSGKLPNENDSNAHLYQKTLELTMDWGEQWKDRIKDRIKQLHPNISNDELDKIAHDCQEIRKFGHNVVQKQHSKGKVSDKDFRDKIKTHYPQLSPQNIERLFKEASDKVGVGGKQSPKNVKNAFINFFKKI